MNTTLTRRPAATSAHTQAVSKGDVVHRLNRAQSIIVAANALIGSIEDYDNREYLTDATGAMLAAEKILTSTIRRAEDDCGGIQEDVYSVAGICSLVSKVLWDECAVCSNAATHASTALDEAEDILTDVADTVVTLVTSH